MSTALRSSLISPASVQAKTDRLFAEHYNRRAFETVQPELEALLARLEAKNLLDLAEGEDK